MEIFFLTLTSVYKITYLIYFTYFSEPCTVIHSDSSLIVDIEESRGNQITQDIIPKELEISGINMSCI